MGNPTLLACGMAAGPLFTIAYLLEGASRVDYKPFRHPVSSLALGRAGPSHLGALLIGVWAVCLLGAGACRTDPVSGYPAGTPDQLHRPTRGPADRE